MGYVTEKYPNFELFCGNFLANTARHEHTTSSRGNYHSAAKWQCYKQWI
jgi:hypothetical protein